MEMSNMSAETGDHQWEILLIQNANLTANKIYLLTFKLTTSSAIRKPNTGKRIYIETFVEIDALLTALKAAQNVYDIKTMKVKVWSVRNETKALSNKLTDLSDEKTPKLTLKDAVKSVKQIQMASDDTPKGKMLPNF